MFARQKIVVFSECYKYLSLLVFLYVLILIRNCLRLDFDLEKFTVENWKSYFEGKDVLFVALGSIFAEARRQPDRAIVIART